MGKAVCLNVSEGMERRTGRQLGVVIRARESSVLALTILLRVSAMIVSESALQTTTRL